MAGGAVVQPDSLNMFFSSGVRYVNAVDIGSKSSFCQRSPADKRKDSGKIGIVLWIHNEHLNMKYQKDRAVLPCFVYLIKGHD